MSYEYSNRVKVIIITNTYKCLNDALIEEDKCLKDLERDRPCKQCLMKLLSVKGLPVSGKYTTENND